MWCGEGYTGASVGRRPRLTTMPAVLSKGDGGTVAKREASQELKFKKLLMVIGPGVFTNVVSAAMLFTARQASVGKIFKTQGALASFLSRLVSMSAFFELVTNIVDILLG